MAEGTQDDKTQTPKVNITPAKPNKGANGLANGEVSQGTTDSNAGHGDIVQKTAPAQARTTLVEVHLNDDVRNDPNARVGSVVGGPAVGRNKYGGTPGDPWGTRARLDAQRQAQHERNMQAQAAQRQAWRDNSARVARDFAAKKAATQEAINRGDFTDLKTISADTWKALGERNGEIRSSYVKDENGNLVQDGVDENGKPKFKMTYQEGQGTKFNATERAKDVAALEKWWAEEGVATSQGKIPKGVFDEKGKLNTEGLTTDQFGALQKIMENSQARLAPLRERAKMNDAQNYLNASEYLSKKGVKVWDTATGQRILSRDQVMQAARELKMTDVREALKGLTAPGSSSGMERELGGARTYFDGGKSEGDYRKEDESRLMQKMRQLGFRADQLADDSGNIDYGRIAAALGEKAPAPEAAAPAPKATPKPAPKTAAAPAPKATPKPAPKTAAAPAPKGTKPVGEAPAAPAAEVHDEAWAKRVSQTYREIMGIPEAPKPFSPSDLLFFKSLDKVDNRPSLTPRRGTPLSEELAGVLKTVPDGVDPTVHAFQSRGLNPLQTATMIAGAVPAGITQVAGGTTRILSGGDVARGFTDIGLGALTAAGGAAFETTAAGAADRIAAARAARRGGTLPKNRYAGGAMPGSSTAKATARRLEARVAEGEGVINLRSVSQPLGRKETAKVEAGYRRGAQMERNVKAAKAREAAEALVRKFERASRRRAAAEREDIRKAHEAGLRAQRAEQRRQVQDRIRRNERKAGYPEPAKKRRHN